MKLTLANAFRKGSVGEGNSPSPTPGEETRWNAACSAIQRYFTPNQILSSSAMRTLFVGEVIFLVVLWADSPYAVLPRPIEVARALGNLWETQGLAYELMTSFRLNIEALGLSTAISLILAYLTALPVFRPLAHLISKGRFLSIAGFSLVFTLAVGGGHPLKVSLMVFGMTVFFLTSMVSVVDSIPHDQYDHARTLRMNEWQVLWEVVIIGTLDKALDVMRQNAAIGWMMLTMVEGIVRSEGGVGTLLLTEGKHFQIAAVFAIQIVILAVGLLQDGALGLIRNRLFPYAQMTVERG